MGPPAAADKAELLEPQALQLARRKAEAALAFGQFGYELVGFALVDLEQVGSALAPVEQALVAEPRQALGFSPLVAPFVV